MSVSGFPSQSFHQSNQTVLLPAANVTLSAADSGKIFLLPNLTANQTITLPALSPGLHYVFINSALAANNWIITSTTAITAGTLIAPGGNPASAAGTTISFVGGTSLVGDRVEYYSAGTRWSVIASTGVAAGIVAA